MKEWLRNHKPFLFILVTGVFPALLGLGTANSATDKKPATHDEKVEALKTKLSLAQSQLNTLNKNKSCDGDGDCDVLEVGWRHCGGPSDYIIVSQQNPNTKDIQKKIEEITQLEREIALAAPPLDCTSAPKFPQAVCEKQECRAR